MERNEFKVLVKAMKAVYAQPTFIPDADAFEIWFQLLKDLPCKIANLAVQKYMVTERFPPTIADIRAKASEAVEVQPEEVSELQAWSLVRKAVGNSGYHADEEFAKLPEACRIAVGSAGNLREWALMESDQVETVEQSHFIRNYRAAAKRISEDGKLPEAVRNQIRQTREEHARLAEQRKMELDGQKQEAIQQKPEEPERPQEMSAETRRKLDEPLQKIRR